MFCKQPSSPLLAGHVGHTEGGVERVGEDQPGPPLLRHRPVCAAVESDHIGDHVYMTVVRSDNDSSQ